MREEKDVHGTVTWLMTTPGAKCGREIPEVVIVPKMQAHDSKKLATTPATTTIALDPGPLS